MGEQTEIPVPAEAPADARKLDLALTFWSARNARNARKLDLALTFWSARNARKLARHVDEGCWELGVWDPSPSPVAMPPLLVAGRTREECLRAAIAAAREALVRHLADLDERAARLADRRRDVAGFLGRGS